MAAQSTNDLIDSMAAAEIGKAFSVLVDNLVGGDSQADDKFAKAVSVINDAKAIAAKVLGGPGPQKLQARVATATSKRTRRR
jgi:hypothetical protein